MPRGSEEICPFLARFIEFLTYSRWPSIASHAAPKLIFPSYSELLFRLLLIESMASPSRRSGSTMARVGQSRFRRSILLAPPLVLFPLPIDLPIRVRAPLKVSNAH